MEESPSHPAQEGRIIVRVEEAQKGQKRRRHLTSVYTTKAALPRVFDLLNDLRRERTEAQCARLPARLAG